MNKTILFIKREAVLCISGVLAIFSCFLVPPSKDYLKYINLHVLILLFCLMLVVAGIRKTGAFTVVCEALLRKFNSMKAVGLLLVLLSFFMSMLLTNDVTLVTIVPFTLLIFEKIQNDKKPLAIIILLVLETIGANLGSMLTPMGNPQNLYLYTEYNLSLGEFIEMVLPYSALSLVLLIVSVFVFIPSMKTEAPSDTTQINGKLKLVLYCVLFAVNMLTVAKIMDAKILLAVIVIAMIILDRKLFANVDYSLLLTFVFFFVFVGNIGNITAISDKIESVLHGREIAVAVASSQVISNVPAAILLSELTDNAKSLLIGINLGGLGTLIASMASLITYKYYAKSEGSKPHKYILIFTLMSVSYLVILLAFNAVIS